VYLSVVFFWEYLAVVLWTCVRKTTFRLVADIISTFLVQIVQLGSKQHNNKVQQKMHGVTHFNRIQMPISSDPLTGMFQSYLPLELFMIV
jgi:hypothetical protein